MFAAEKGLLEDLLAHFRAVDARKRENRSAASYAQNPSGGIPWFVFDDARAVAETSAMCELMEEAVPEPRLFGSNLFERAETLQWQHSVKL